MNYEEMVKLNIDTRMSKGDLVEMMCEEMSDYLDKGIKRLYDELVAIEKSMDESKEAYVAGLAKALKISLEKGSLIETADIDNHKHTKDQIAELSRLKDEYHAVPTIERGNSWRCNSSFPYEYDHQREKFEVPVKYQVSLEEHKDINSKMIKKTSTYKNLNIFLSEEAVKELAKKIRDMVFVKKVIECKIAIEKRKFESVSKAAPKFRAQITRKILEATPDGLKVLDMLDDVSRKLNMKIKQIAEK